MNAAELCAMLGENPDMSISSLNESQRTAIEQWKAQAGILNASLAIVEPTDPSDPVPDPVPEPDDYPKDPESF